MIKNFNELNEMSAKCSACLDAKFTGSDGKRHIVLCGGTGCLSSRSDEITAELKRLIEAKGLEDAVTITKLVVLVSVLKVLSLKFTLKILFTDSFKSKTVQKLSKRILSVEKLSKDFYTLIQERQKR